MVSVRVLLMFSYDTDLTLDSIMVGKNTTKNSERDKDQRSMNVVLSISSPFVNLPTYRIEDDTLSTSGLYMCFGKYHNTLTEMYCDYTEIEDGAGVCECCGLTINIFNRTAFSICKDCNNYYENDSYL